MESNAKGKGGLSGIVAGRIRSAASVWTTNEDCPDRETRSPELHMESVSQIFDETDPTYTTHSILRRDLEKLINSDGIDVIDSASARGIATLSQRYDVTMEEALEVVALPSPLSESQYQFASIHGDGSQSPVAGPEETTLTVRNQRKLQSRTRSASNAKQHERELPKVKAILKRTLSLRLHRHPSPLKLLGGVDVDNKSHLSTQPSTNCGTKVESIECKVLDSRVQSSALIHRRGIPHVISNVAEMSGDNSFDMHLPAATSDDNATNEIDILNVLTFIEVDVEEADWEETGVSAMTAGSSSYFGDAASSRRAVERVPRNPGYKSTNADYRRLPPLTGDAKLHNDLVAFLEVSAVPNDTGLPQARPTGTLPSFDPPTISGTHSAIDESKEFTYEDAVVIRDESHSKSYIQFHWPADESLVVADRKKSLLGVKVASDDTQNEASDGIASIEVDYSTCTGTTLVNLNENEHATVAADDNDLCLVQEAVEVLHTGGTTTVASHGATESENLTKGALLEIGSTNAKIGDSLAEKLPHVILSGSLDQHSVVEIKGTCVRSSSMVSGCVATGLVKENEISSSRNQNEKHNLYRNVGFVDSHRLGDLSLESFELSPTGNVLSTQWTPLDDDSELAVIGQAMPYASTDASEDDTIIGSAKAKTRIAETLNSVAKPLGSVRCPTHGHSTCDFSAPTHSSNDEEDAATKPSISGHQTSALDPDAVVEEIRRTLAVNGESALRDLSQHLHEHTPRKRNQDMDGCAVLSSYSREALVDNDELSGADGRGRNQESEPLIPRSAFDDPVIQSAISDLVDSGQCMEPECESTFDKLCVTDHLEKELSEVNDSKHSETSSGAKLKEVLTKLADPVQREHPQKADEKKEDELYTTLESSCLPSSYQEAAMRGGAFYERRKVSRYGYRPLYDEEFTWGFLHGMMSSGVTLLHLQATTETEGKSSLEQAVTMVVEPGSKTPRLEWTTMGANPSTEVMGLFDIHSIQGYSDDETREESPNCFAVSTLKGVVHVFQAGSTYDRDLVVLGVRNLVAWLCYHLAAGDATASSMLDGEGDDPVFLHKASVPSELPTASHRLRQMNVLAHAMLD